MSLLPEGNAGIQHDPCNNVLLSSINDIACVLLLRSNTPGSFVQCLRFVVALGREMLSGS
jgi:hypothetical protein